MWTRDQFKAHEQALYPRFKEPPTAPPERCARQAAACAFGRNLGRNAIACSNMACNGQAVRGGVGTYVQSEWVAPGRHLIRLAWEGRSSPGVEKTLNLVGQSTPFVLAKKEGSVHVFMHM